jgi:hypothetical protein
MKVGHSSLLYPQETQLLSISVASPDSSIDDAEDKIENDTSRLGMDLMALLQDCLGQMIFHRFLQLL